MGRLSPREWIGQGLVRGGPWVGDPGHQWGAADLEGNRLPRGRLLGGRLSGICRGEARSRDSARGRDGGGSSRGLPLGLLGTSLSEEGAGVTRFAPRQLRLRSTPPAMDRRRCDRGEEARLRRARGVSASWPYRKSWDHSFGVIAARAIKPWSSCRASPKGHVTM